MNSLLQRDLIIVVSVLSSSNLLSGSERNQLISQIKSTPQLVATVQSIAKRFDNSRLIRELRLYREFQKPVESLTLEHQGNDIYFKNQKVGNLKILFKSTLPGELQARLSTESIIERLLEYLEKVHKIAVLNESDHHVEIFIPDTVMFDLTYFWKDFIKNVAFSTYGKYGLPGLMQTLVAMLNSVTLSGRGFSTLEIPIINREQAELMAAWYFAVWRDAKQRQNKRQAEITALYQDLDVCELSEKELTSKKKELSDKEAMQNKEAKKYQELFLKSFEKLLNEHLCFYQDLSQLEIKLKQEGLTKKEVKKIEKQKNKILDSLIFPVSFLENKLALLEETGGDPFRFIKSDYDKNPIYFRKIETIAKSFTKTATDQINGTRGDIFAKCIMEMYRLLELTDSQFEPLPESIVTETLLLPRSRSPGDDHKEFCYSCGIGLDPKEAKWQVLRFMFERPSQRRQSASGEGRPHICASCALLAFACPLKVTDESIILKLEPIHDEPANQSRLKDYLRMLTCKSMNLNAGKYIVIASDKTNKGDTASSKLGQVQYALAKISTLFSVEVLKDFKFSLVIQGGNTIPLYNRHLILAKGIMEGYYQTIIEAGKDINMKLGDAIRYIQKDLPYLAEYSTSKSVKYIKSYELEKIRQLYYSTLVHDLITQGDDMDSDCNIAKRALLYKNVAGLTGLTYSFVSALKHNYMRDLEKQEKYSKQEIEEKVDREMSKLIEQVDDPNFFGYYATLGVEKIVEARLWKNQDNYFIYQQTQNLLNLLGQSDREKTENGKTWLHLYIDDVANAYSYFANNDQYPQDKDWKELTYQLKLSLYTRFPELVRKSKNSGDN